MTMTAVNRPGAVFGATDIYVPEHGYWAGMVMSSKREVAVRDTSDILWSDWDATFNGLRTDYVRRADSLRVGATDLMNAAIDIGTDALSTLIAPSFPTFTDELENQYRELLRHSEIDDDYWFTYYLVTNGGKENIADTLCLLSDFDPETVFSWIRAGHTLAEAEMFMRADVGSDLAAIIAQGE